MLMYILSVFILFMQFVKYVQVCLASYFITAHVILHFTLFICIESFVQYTKKTDYL